MSQRVLFVDDDPKILKGIARQFEDTLDLDIANGPEHALEQFDQGQTFAVVVSDMRMPNMSGVELLSAIRQRSPETVRIMLTGFADLESTIEAVNEGNIFRFLSKPCTHDVLKKAVEDGLKQYRLVHSEKELLEGTLHGSIKVLSEMLSLVNPLAFGRTSQVQRISLGIGQEMDYQRLWDLKIASMLFPLGCVTISEKSLESVLNGKAIPDGDEAAFASHAALASGMLKSIPRLEHVAEIVAYQDKGFDGSGLPQDGVHGEAIPLGGRILKLAADFEIKFKRCGDANVALEKIETGAGPYDPQVLSALKTALHSGLCQACSRDVSIEDLEIGMILSADLRGLGGQLLVASGQEITQSLRFRLQKLFANRTIGEMIQIEVLGEFQNTAATIV